MLAQINYNQIFRYFKVNCTLQNSFCRIFTKETSHFALFKMSKDGKINCLYLNEIKSLEPISLFYFLSPALNVNIDDVVFDDVSEFSDIEKPVAQNNLINFFYHIIPLADVPWDDNLYSILSFDGFNGVYLDSDKDNISFILSNKENSLCDILRFNAKTFSQRFNDYSGFWTSEYFSNAKEGVICFYPYNLVRFFDDKFPVDYFSIVMARYDYNLLNSIKLLLDEYGLPKLNILYSHRIEDLKLVLKFIIDYSIFYNNLNIQYQFFNDELQFSFLLPSDVDTLKYIQFTSDVQKANRLLISTSDNEISSRLIDAYPIKSYRFNIFSKTVFTIKIPLKIECFEAFMNKYIGFARLSEYFNLVKCN